MSSRSFLRALVLAVFVLPSVALAAQEVRGRIASASTAVNPVVGDVSFVEAFGRFPTAEDDEDLRLRTHLRYVEQLLRARDDSHLTEARAEARSKILDVLHEYHRAGDFPRNRDLPGRRPCFVDTVTGNVCAVGYLMERTLGRDVVEAVNADYQYAAIFQIDAPLLDTWLDEHGLTRVEAAMIQPFYSSLVDVEIESTGHVTVVPDGSGASLASEGHSIQIRLEDGNGDPIVGYPYQDLWLGPENGVQTLALCNGGSVADADTDANGETTFTAALRGGGWTSDPVYVYVAGVIVQESPLDLTINSPDLTGDRRVDLSDIGLFAQDLAAGYAFRSDIGGDLDGVVDLGDVGVLALAVGTACP